MTGGSKYPYIPGGEARTFREDDGPFREVLSGKDDILSRGYGSLYQDIVPNPFRVLDHHGGISAGREHGTCREVDPLTSPQGTARFSSHGDLPCHPEDGRKGLPGPDCLRGPDRVTVHGRPCEPGDIFPCDRIPGEDAVQGFPQGDLFLRGMRGDPQDHADGFLESDDPEKEAHPKQPSWHFLILTLCLLQYLAISILGIPYFSDISKAFGQGRSLPIPDSSKAFLMRASSMVTIIPFLQHSVYHRCTMGALRVAVINSAQDQAGRNIRRHMEELLPASGIRGMGGPSFELHEVEGRLIHADGIDREYPSDLLLFISRHTSRDPVPVLTVHVTGNLSGADLGGRPRSLPPACPPFMQAILRELRRRAPPGYAVSYEVTHHGPTELTTPSFFAEIGSTATEWADPRAGRAVAESILAAVPTDAIPLIGFGGNHYAARQTEIACTSRGAFGHIAHSREVGALDGEMVVMMRDRSRAAAAYIDRKALDTRDLSHIEEILGKIGLPVLTEGEILSVGEMEWSSYLAVRTLAGEAYPGARCHPHRLTTLGRPVIVGMDPVLVAEAAKSDEKGFIAGLELMPVVHLSGGGRNVLPAFVTDEERKDGVIHDLINLCVKIIIERQDAAVEGDRLIIRRFRFDPGKASALGVPKGPLFGRLSAGDEIDLDGRVIAPSMVQTARITEIHIPGLESYL